MITKVPRIFLSYIFFEVFQIIAKTIITSLEDKMCKLLILATKNQNWRSYGYYYYYYYYSLEDQYWW